MTENDDNPRAAAIRGFKEREAREDLSHAERERAEREKAERHEQNLIKWSAKIANEISLGVNKSNNEFARLWCDSVFVHQPNMRRGSATYEVRRSGHLKQCVAELTFMLRDHGFVSVETDAHGAEMPDPIPLARSPPLGRRKPPISDNLCARRRAHDSRR